jgi:hypothetical protein
LACQDEFFVCNPLDVKDNEQAVDLALHLSCLPWSQRVQTFLAWFMLSFLGLYCSPSEICIKSDVISMSGPSQNDIMPDTWQQIKGHKKSAHPSSCVKFRTLTPKI